MFALLLCRPEFPRDSMGFRQTLLETPTVSVISIRPERFFRR
jgi:hypothetical protein